MSAARLSSRWKMGAGLVRLLALSDCGGPPFPGSSSDNPLLTHFCAPGTRPGTPVLMRSVFGTTTYGVCAPEAIFNAGARPRSRSLGCTGKKEWIVGCGKGMMAAELRRPWRGFIPPIASVPQGRIRLFLFPRDGGQSRFLYH
jgi:hypothetical protein